MHLTGLPDQAHNFYFTYLQIFVKVEVVTTVEIEHTGIDRNLY